MEEKQSNEWFIEDIFKYSTTHRFIDTKDILDSDMYLFKIDGWNK